MQVKVWNDGNKEYTEHFNGRNITIPPKGWILMDKAEATMFKGTFRQPAPEECAREEAEKYYKPIRVENTPHVEVVEKKWVCQMDGTEFKTEVELNKYIEENFKDSFVDKEEAQGSLNQASKKRGRPKGSVNTAKKD